MVRTYPTAFAGHLTDKNTAPYFILEVQWGTPFGTKYYMDRKTDSFSASGTRCPDTVEDSLVVDWGQIGLQLKEMQIGAVDSLTLKIEDHGGEISAMLNAGTPKAISDLLGTGGTLNVLNPLQKRIVRIWKMFDTDDVTWHGGSSGASDALVFVGTTKPFAWSESGNVITIEVEDPSRLLTASVGQPASLDVFSKVTADYQDRCLPICWGYAERVEAVLVSSPWSTKVVQEIDWGAINSGIYGSSGTNFVDVDDHPDDLGISLTAGVSAELEVYLGSDEVMRECKGKFHLSGDKTTTPSQFEITVAPSAAAGVSAIDHLTGEGTVYAKAFIDRTVFSTGDLLDNPDYFIRAGIKIGVNTCSGYMWGTVRDVDFSDATYIAIRFVEQDVTTAMGSGNELDIFAQMNDDNWRPGAGTKLRPRTGDWVYVANAFRSKKVFKVEGYGNVSDEGGNNSKDFVLLSNTYSITYDSGQPAGVITATGSSYSVNLDDSTWNLGTGTKADLGGNVTTITFSQPPRDLFRTLEDNRVWVTLLGTVDASTPPQAIVNPADVILRYLRDPRLMNIDNSNLNLTSFANAKSKINDSTIMSLQAHVDGATVVPYLAGFAQVEAKDGLTLVQDIARQCHSIIYFDQGQLSMGVLYNTPSSTAASFDEDNIKAATFNRSETDVYDVVTRLKSTWKYSWAEQVKTRAIRAFNWGADLAIGANEKEIELNIFNDRRVAVLETAFWMRRWSRVYREVTFTTFSAALILQPGDWILLSYVQGVLFSASDLVYEGSNVVSSGSHSFTALDVGKKLTLTNVAGTGVYWVQGSYVIASVADGKATLASEPVSLPPDTPNPTGGHWKLGGQQIVPNGTQAEVLEVKDREDGTVDLKVRYPQFSY